MKMKKILELGSGKHPYKPKKGEEVIHLDIVKLPHIEVVHDLNKFPWPFEDDEFDEIIANNVLEHLNDIVKVMKEIWRILKPKGILKARVPYFAHPNAFTDPTHKQFFTLHTFDYWDPSTNAGQDLGHEVGRYRFKIKRKELIFLGKKAFLRFFNRIPDAYEVILSRILPADEIYIELEKIK